MEKMEWTLDMLTREDLNKIGRDNFLFYNGKNGFLLNAESYNKLKDTIYHLIENKNCGFLWLTSNDTDYIPFSKNATSREKMDTIEAEGPGEDIVCWDDGTIHCVTDLNYAPYPIRKDILARAVKYLLVPPFCTAADELLEGFYILREHDGFSYSAMSDDGSWYSKALIFEIDPDNPKEYRYTFGEEFDPFEACGYNLKPLNLALEARRKEIETYMANEHRNNYWLRTFNKEYTELYEKYEREDNKR